MSVSCCFVSVCNAGYFKSEGSCVLCPGLTIKTTIGDAENCDTDTPCDGMTTIPGAGHTRCGMFVCVVAAVGLRGSRNRWP